MVLFFGMTIPWSAFGSDPLSCACPDSILTASAGVIECNLHSIQCSPQAALAAPPCVIKTACLHQGKTRRYSRVHAGLRVVWND
jgi:hypothetical protein